MLVLQGCNSAPQAAQGGSYLFLESDNGCRGFSSVTVASSGAIAFAGAPVALDELAPTLDAAQPRADICAVLILAPADAPQGSAEAVVAALEAAGFPGVRLMRVVEAD